MAHANSTDTGVSPGGSTSIDLHNQQQSVLNVSQGGVQNGGVEQRSNAISTPSFVHSSPAINTVDTKKSYDMDAVDVLIGVSSPQTGVWGDIKFEKKNRSIDKIKKTMICFNYFGMGHNKKKCKNPTHCHECKNEYIPVSEVCRNAWGYVKIGKGHKKYSNGNYNNGNYVDKDYINKNYNNRGNFRGNFRSYYRGGGTYNQYHNDDYGQNKGRDYKHENNVYKKSYGDHNHISMLNAAFEQQE